MTRVSHDPRPGRCGARSPLALSVLGLALLAGCGAAAQHGEPSASTPSGPRTAASAQPASLQVVSAAEAQTEQLVSRPWTLLQVADGRTVVVQYAIGGCDTVPRSARVDETDRAVTLYVLTRGAPPGAVCTAQEKTGTARLDLPQPLGGRPLVQPAAG